MNEHFNIWLYALVPVVAFMYASVGHGGASGYLLLMTLFGVSAVYMRPTALILNILVSLLAFINYNRITRMPWKLFLLLVVCSVPAAYWGGSITIDQHIFRKILGVVLLFPAIRLFGFFSIDDKKKNEFNLPGLLIIGSGIGFISGLIGIGGGIILSPVLLLLGWADVRETAAVSALFITFNSIAGLFGLNQSAIDWNNGLLFLVISAFAGGFLGSYFGAKYFNQAWLKRLLAVVIVIACVKLLIT